MDRAYDLVIRNGLVIDGAGAERFEADVAIRDGRIAAIGHVGAAGAQEIDARGKMVTPGFVDIHTHYDGQAVWSDRLSPSSSHGVTTVVGGNCGVGFAPCRPEHRELLVSVMEGVEDIPEVVMTEGLTWDWQTYPEYLDAIEKRPHDIDFASQIPHSAVRVFVMGQRGADREPATEDDLKRMQAVVREAIDVGALGFATSRLVIHKTGQGDAIPSWQAAESELEAMAMALKDAGHGVLQAVFGESGRTFQDEIDLLSRLTRMSGRPASFSMAQSNDHPEAWRDVMRHLAEANMTGPAIRAQVYPRPIGVVLGFDLTINPFSLCPSYQPLANLPFAERIAALRDPLVRARLLMEEPLDAVIPLARLGRRFDFMYPLGDPPDYEPAPETSLAAQGAARGVSPAEIAYDLLLENGGRGLLLVALANYGSGSLDPIYSLITDSNSVLGLGDGGAHYGMICDSSYPTFVMQHWTRERLGQRLSIEEAVKALTSDPARAIGLDDRGVLSVGRKADLNVIDYDQLRLDAPQVLYDLPAGGRRITQGARGYDAMIVSGQVVSRHGEPTGALPGRLVRGPQAAPALR
ncbi:MAG TPA: amidohydrolase family protein [Caulobacteraceae bacterium]|jgi:N-acyl-D-aspartate/D-glutamate deacylase|nr:amidohydrolase family protein [Caulobacteraceae bacterium]